MGIDSGGGCESSGRKTEKEEGGREQGDGRERRRGKAAPKASVRRPISPWMFFTTRPLGFILFARRGEAKSPHRYNAELESTVQMMHG